ncbi:MAG TPA: hypothetical protein HA232_05115 [Methanocellales archaeon]|nr:hypothetical protein [Methanocellales archaeon]
MLPTEDQLRDPPFWNEDLGGMIRNCPLSNNDIGVFDILGEYFPIEKKIVVYTELCHLTALRTGLRYEDIIAIVIAHEASHAVTHLGRDRQDKNWENFPNIDAAVLEHFAQMYTRMHLTESGYSEVVNAFEVLSEGQPLMYRSWLTFHNFNKTMLNGSLLWARWYYQNVMHEASTEDVYPNSGIGDDRKDFSSKMVDSIFEKMTGQEQLIEKAFNLGEVPTKTKNQIDTSLYTIENIVELYFGDLNPDGTLNKDYDDALYKSLTNELVFVRERFFQMKHTVKEVLSWTVKSRT